MRHVDAASGAAAQHRPRMHLGLPRAGKHGARVLRVHRETRAAGVLVDEEHAVPVLAAVGRAVDAALLLRRGDAPHDAREDDVGVRRMHEDAADAAGLVESHVRPRAAGVHRLVDAVADHVAVANRPRFAGAGPDDVRIGGRDGERADRRHRHAVGHRHPADAAVGRLPHAARRGAGVIDRRIARHAGDRRDAVADDGAEEAEREAVRLRAAAALGGMSEEPAGQLARQYEMRLSKGVVLAVFISRQVGQAMSQSSAKVVSLRHAATEADD